MIQISGYISDLVGKIVQSKTDSIVINMRVLKRLRFNESRKGYNMLRRSIDRLPGDIVGFGLTRMHSSQVPAEAIKTIEKIVSRLGLTIPQRFTLYDGGDKKDQTYIHFSDLLVQAYWVFQDILNVDTNLLNNRCAELVELKVNPRSRGYGFRISPLGVTKIPQWVRASVFPASDKRFIYFDVVNAEFANLLLFVEPTLEDIYRDGDLYDWVAGEIAIPNSISRTQVKQFCMAMICGGTYKAACAILNMNTVDANSLIDRFWSLLPKVKNHLDDIASFFILSGGNPYNWEIPVIGYEKYCASARTDNSSDDERKRSLVLAAHVRDSFLIHFAHYLQETVFRFFPRICYTWVDSCLIPSSKDINVECFRHPNFKFKIGLGWGEDWLSAQKKTLTFCTWQ